MDIVGGERAIGLAQKLVAAADIVGLEVYPKDLAQTAPQLLALAGAQGASLVVDVGAAPAAWDILRANKPFAARDGKTLARALLRGQRPLPPRWASLDVTRALLHAGRDEKPAASCPPGTDASLQGLALGAVSVRDEALAQAEQVRADDAVGASRLEAAAVSPLARLEHAGMPLAAEAWQAAVAAEAHELAGLCASLQAQMGVSSALLLGPQAPLVAALRKLGHAVHTLRPDALRDVRAPWVPAFVRLRELLQLDQAFGASFLRHLDSRDGRVRATFVQIGAQTGRIACQAPNLQAVPKKHGRRACFRPAAGHVFVSADYAACELRILAEMSQDATYLQAFARGEDVHAQVATTVFRQRVSRTHAQHLREAAKTLSFGLIYGMQAEGLAKLLHCSSQEAEDLMRRFFATYPRVQAYLEDSVQEALRRGYARTLSGRRLYLQGHNGRFDGHTARLARNMPIQGTGADLIKLALARLDAKLQTQLCAAQVVHCVHDAFLVECPTAAAEAVGAAMAEAMEAAGAQLLHSVRCTIDCASASSWQ